VWERKGQPNSKKTKKHCQTKRKIKSFGNGQPAIGQMHKIKRTAKEGTKPEKKVGREISMKTNVVQEKKNPPSGGK